MTHDVMILGGEESVKHITTFFKIQILETKKMTVKWKEAKMIILHKKETRETLKITGLSVFFPSCTNCSHRYYKKEWIRLWMKTKQENMLVSEKVTQQLTILK